MSFFEQNFIFCLNKKNEPVHDKAYNKTCATVKDSDQPVHLRSLIRVSADCISLLSPPGYPKRDRPCRLGVMAPDKFLKIIFHAFNTKFLFLTIFL